MRLPRLRISLKTVMLIVAVVAMNCAAYRYEYTGWNNYESDGVLGVFLDGFVPAVTPLLNVALIGSFLFVIRQLRARGRRSDFNPKPKPAGVTFFSLHFLAPCSVAAALISRQSAFDNAAPSVPRAWLVAFFERDLSIPEALTRDIILGVSVSGPLLLLSCVGGLLAGRYAARVTARRFLVLTCMVSLGFASVAFSLLLTPRDLPREQEVELAFQVLDKNSSQPVRTAYVQLTDPFGVASTPHGSLTGPDGCARLSTRFQAFGERTAFHTFGSFSTRGWWLTVSAPEYQTRRIPLPEILGPQIDLNQSAFEKVLLAKGKSPVNSYNDIAGTYYHFVHHGGSMFQNYRESDLTKPQIGLPRLPARVWLMFALQEASLSNGCRPQRTAHAVARSSSTRGPRMSSHICAKCSKVLTLCQSNEPCPYCGSRDRIVFDVDVAVLAEKAAEHEMYCTVHGGSLSRLNCLRQP